jgi:hypothetical protein
MEFRPICSAPGCGGLGIYRCGECHRVFCGQHVEVATELSAQGIESRWRVRCDTCRARVPSAPYPWGEPVTEHG